MNVSPRVAFSEITARRLARLLLAGGIAAAAGWATPVLAHVYQVDNTTAAAIPTVVGWWWGWWHVDLHQCAPDLAIRRAYNGTQASMACNTLAVANEPGFNTINGPVTISISMSHTWVGDLVIKLFPPAGGGYTLVSRPGTAVDNGTEWEWQQREPGDRLAVAVLHGGRHRSRADWQRSRRWHRRLRWGRALQLQPERRLGRSRRQPGPPERHDQEWQLATLHRLPAGDTGVLAAWTLDFGSVGSPDTSDALCDDGTSSLNVTFTVSETFTAASGGCRSECEPCRAWRYSSAACRAGRHGLHVVQSGRRYRRQLRHLPHQQH